MQTLYFSLCIIVRKKTGYMLIVTNCCIFYCVMYKIDCWQPSSIGSSSSVCLFTNWKQMAVSRCCSLPILKYLYSILGQDFLVRKHIALFVNNCNTYHKYNIFYNTHFIIKVEFVFKNSFSFVSFFVKPKV